MTNPYRKPYDVDIIVVGWNKWKLTERCIFSVRETTPAPSYRITFVDNGSDESFGGLSLNREDVPEDNNILIQLPFNHGYCRGVNVGLSMAMLSPSKYILLLNNDTEIPRGDTGWLQRMVDAIESAPDIGAVGPVSDMVGGYQRGDGSHPPNAVAVVPALIGFCLLLKKSVVRQIGFLDERFEPGMFDDFDYSKRMTDAGYRLLIAGSVFIHHKAHSTTNDTGGTNLYQTNKAKFIEKWGDYWQTLGLEDVNLEALKAAGRGPVYSIETKHPVAVDSPDHIHPMGTLRDNSINPKFNAKLIALFAGRKPSVLDIGCAGGGFVQSLVEDGCEAVGIEGSDYSEVRQRAAWGVIPERLFTADLAKPFQIDRNGIPTFFDVVTAWEVLEHIRECDLPMVLSNVKDHLKPDGYFIATVSDKHSPHHLDGTEMHQTIQPPLWWAKLMAAHGFKAETRKIEFFTPDWVRSDSPAFVWTVGAEVRGTAAVFAQSPETVAA